MRCMAAPMSSAQALFLAKERSSTPAFKSLRTGSKAQANRIPLSGQSCRIPQHSMNNNFVTLPIEAEAKHQW